MGLNFQYYDGLQPKIRAGIINENECMAQKNKCVSHKNQNKNFVKKKITK